MSEYTIKPDLSGLYSFAHETLDRIGRQPRERPVPCVLCRKETWAFDRVCHRHNQEEVAS